ncbi:NADH-quinone oxidoreductase subunit F [Bienertia sinuspersici]
MSAHRRSKRSRAQLDPSPEPELEPGPGGNPYNPNLKDIDFPNTKFRDAEHFLRFQCLKLRRIVATRFFSDECATALGIKSDLEWLFERVGWTNLMMNRYFTFRELTLEFLSSFQQNTVKIPKGQLPGVRFRMFNREFYKTIDEFGDFYGLPRGGNVNYYNSDPSMVWRQITGSNDYNPQSSKASRIQNPVFRYLQRLMANTIFGRHDSQGTVREWEMEMLQSMLYPPEVPVSTASYIARHFHAVGKSKKKSPIVVGGLITPIAVSLGFNFDQIEPVGAIPTLDIPKLVSMGWLHEDGDRYRWVVNKKPTFFLPNPKRTTIRNQANWELSENFSSDGEEENDEENEYQTDPPSFLYEGLQGGSSSPSFPQPPPQTANGDFAALFASLDSIRTGIRDIQTSQQYMNQRLDQFDQMLYPIYNWHVQQGHINPNILPYPDPNYPLPRYRPPGPPGF